jgi:phosphopantothenoylcysteine decarboxylase/phosphopantothenate--cysteine ligase
MKKVLLAVTASIAGYKACDLIRLLRDKDYDVKCLMSKAARWFITEMTLETLSGNKVVCDIFSPPATKIPEHISLAEERDIILVAPATADILAKTACGICDDIVTCTICAFDKPVIFAPAMNDKMYRNPIVRRNIEKLKSNGYHFVGPVNGHLACDSYGEGHIAPPEEIISFIEDLCK